MIYIDDLYQKVIVDNIEEATELHIISGYVSALYTEKLITQYPQVKIKVYIGMALDGISFDSHLIFKSLMEKYPESIEVYYQIARPKTHAKIYSFLDRNGKKTSFIGSANLSENGFENYQEILVRVDTSLKEIFEKIENKSMLCNQKDVMKFIPFYIEDGRNDYHAEITEQTLDDDNGSPIKDAGSNHYYNNKFRRTQNYSEMIIPIIPFNAGTSLSRGINAWNRGQKPYLSESPNYPFAMYFPQTSNFQILTDDGKEFTGQINSLNSSQMILKPNIHTYLSKRIGIEIKRPIDEKDLDFFGNREIRVNQIGDNKYIFDFSPK